MRVITFGTFDIFHIGHLRILERARSYGDYLIVGLSTDELNFSKKQHKPVYPYDQRRDTLKGLQVVDEVFPEESLELKRRYIQQYHADVLVMSDDWAGKFDEFEDICRVIYLPRTLFVSTSATIEEIRGQVSAGH